MRQRAERARQLFAMEAEEEDPEPKAKMQKKLDKLRCFELKLFNDFV